MSAADSDECRLLMRCFRRDSAPNRSIVVMKFRKPSDAVEFIEEFNGKQFNSMEVGFSPWVVVNPCSAPPVVQPETCHVVRVLSVAIEAEDHISQGISRLSSLPLGGTYELPTCPVCLERMDAAVTGLVTVPCSHTFHCACLSKWGDSRCVATFPSTVISSLFFPGAQFADTRRPYCRPTPSLEPRGCHVRSPFHRLLLRMKARTAPTAEAIRTCGYVSSVATLDAVDTAKLMLMRTTSLQPTSMRLSWRHNGSGTTLGTGMSTD